MVIFLPLDQLIHENWTCEEIFSSASRYGMNTRHGVTARRSLIVGSMLGQRRRRWPNIETTLVNVSRSLVRHFWGKQHPIKRRSTRGGLSTEPVRSAERGWFFLGRCNQPDMQPSPHLSARRWFWRISLALDCQSSHAYDTAGGAQTLFAVTTSKANTEQVIYISGSSPRDTNRSRLLAESLQSAESAYSAWLVDIALRAIINTGWAAGGGGAGAVVKAAFLESLQVSKKQ